MSATQTADESDESGQKDTTEAAEALLAAADRVDGYAEQDAETGVVMGERRFHRIAFHTAAKYAEEKDGLAGDQFGRVEDLYGGAINEIAFESDATGAEEYAATLRSKARELVTE